MKEGIMFTIERGDTTQYNGYTLTDMGTMNIGRSTYTIQEQTSYYDNHEPITTLQLKGPRGALYILQEQGQTGVYIPMSLFSGHMVRKGNPVQLIILGNIIEVMNPTTV